MPLFLAATMKRLWRMKRKREKRRERERDGEVKHLSRLCVARGLRRGRRGRRRRRRNSPTVKTRLPRLGRRERGARCNWFSAHGLNKLRGRQDGWKDGRMDRTDSFPKIYSPSNQKLPSFHPKSLILYPFRNTTLSRERCMIQIVKIGKGDARGRVKESRRRLSQSPPADSHHVVASRPQCMSARAKGPKSKFRTRSQSNLR